MSEITHEIDSNFAGRLNILRAGVLGANDGIISIAGVVIGVASATSNIWIIFLSGLAAILAGAFSMAGGEYVSVSTQKDTEEAAVAREQLLLDKDIEAAKKSLYAAYLQNGECDTSAQLLVNKAFLKNPLKALVEEKYGIEYEEFTNPWHAAASSFIAFVLGSLFNNYLPKRLSYPCYCFYRCDFSIDYRLHQCQTRKSPNQNSYDS